VFIVADGAHTQIQCLACHDLETGLSSAKGANTNCIQCHPNDALQASSHVGVRSLTGKAYAYEDRVPSFCLQCHPSGVAGKHPDDRFPRTTVHAVPCESCHDRTAGPDTMGANTTCTDAACHSVPSIELKEGHSGEPYLTDRGDGTSRNFCLLCHPNGKSEEHSQ
jgi:hypothetical protein